LTYIINWFRRPVPTFVLFTTALAVTIMWIFQLAGFLGAALLVGTYLLNGVYVRRRGVHHTLGSAIFPGVCLLVAIALQNSPLYGFSAVAGLLGSYATGVPELSRWYLRFSDPHHLLRRYR
jgi:hypothetical protein